MARAGSGVGGALPVCIVESGGGGWLGKTVGWVGGSRVGGEWLWWSRVDASTGMGSSSLSVLVDPGTGALYVVPETIVAVGGDGTVFDSSTFSDVPSRCLSAVWVALGALIGIVVVVEAPGRVGVKVTKFAASPADTASSKVLAADSSADHVVSKASLKALLDLANAGVPRIVLVKGEAFKEDVNPTNSLVLAGDMRSNVGFQILKAVLRCAGVSGPPLAEFAPPLAADFLGEGVCSGTLTPGNPAVEDGS